MNVLCFYPAPVAANLLYAFGQSNAPGRMIVGLLFVFSVVAWTVMISKGLGLVNAEKQNRTFLFHYRKERDPLALFMKKRNYDNSPAYSVYCAACSRLSDELAGGRREAEDEWGTGYGSDAGGGRISSARCEALRGVGERSVAEQITLLEHQMVALATAVSVSPFLGLLGTVWGVMDSFGGMGQSGAATLSSVAPGIAGALLTTIIGLFVAIPSTIGYNWLCGRIRHLSIGLDNFAQELADDIQNKYVL